MNITRRYMLSTTAAFGAAAALAPRRLWAADTNHVGPGPDIVIPRLMDGNKRFMEGHITARNSPTRRDELATGQYPIAAILSCSDSRLAPETVFDQGLGELFIVRVAGNVVDDFGLASLEYAVVALGVRTVFVLGHSYCGAVKSSLDQAAAAKLPGKLPELTKHIYEGMAGARPGEKPIVKTKDDKLELAVETNAEKQANVLNSTSVLPKYVKTSAMVYCLDTGAVTNLPVA